MNCHLERCLSHFFLGCTAQIFGQMSVEKPHCYITEFRSGLLTSLLPSWLLHGELRQNAEVRAHGLFPSTQGYTFLLVTETENSIFAQVNWFQFHDSEWSKVPLGHVQKQRHSAGSDSSSWRALPPPKTWQFFLKVPFVHGQRVHILICPVWTWCHDVSSQVSHRKPWPGSSDPSPGNLVSLLENRWVLHR